MKHLTEKELAIIKEKLGSKKQELEEELLAIAKKDPRIEGNWKATYEDLEDEWDDSVHEVAEHDVKLSLEHSLELHLKRVVSAMDHIDKGTYGVCEVDGKPIPTERLMVAPETTKCEEHAG